MLFSKTLKFIDLSNLFYNFIFAISKFIIFDNLKNNSIIFVIYIIFRFNIFNSTNKMSKRPSYASRNHCYVVRSSDGTNMESMQDSAFEALAEIFTRVIVSTVELETIGHVNVIFIQLEEDQPKEKSDSVLQRIQVAYPEEAAVVIRRESIIDSVLTHVRSITNAEKGKLANVQGFQLVQLSQTWRLRHSAVSNLNYRVGLRGIDQIDQVVAMILSCEAHKRFLDTFGGNKYYAAKQYAKILNEEASKLKEEAASYQRQEAESDSESRDEEEEVSSTQSSNQSQEEDSDSKSKDEEEEVSSTQSSNQSQEEDSDSESNDDEEEVSSNQVSRKRKEAESDSESSDDEEEVSSIQNSKKRKLSECNSSSNDSIDTTSIFERLPRRVQQILDECFGEDDE
jgi:hypothetical protein